MFTAIQPITLSFGLLPLASKKKEREASGESKGVIGYRLSAEAVITWRMDLLLMETIVKGKVEVHGIEDSSFQLRGLEQPFQQSPLRGVQVYAW